MEGKRGDPGTREVFESREAAQGSNRVNEEKKRKSVLAFCPF